MLVAGYTNQILIVLASVLWSFLWRSKERIETICFFNQFIENHPLFALMVLLPPASGSINRNEVGDLSGLISIKLLLKVSSLPEQIKYHNRPK